MLAHWSGSGRVFSVTYPPVGRGSLVFFCHRSKQRVGGKKSHISEAIVVIAVVVLGGNCGFLNLTTWSIFYANEGVYSASGELKEGI